MCQSLLAREESSNVIKCTHVVFTLTPKSIADTLLLPDLPELAPHLSVYYSTQHLLYLIIPIPLDILSSSKSELP